MWTAAVILAILFVMVMWKIGKAAAKCSTDNIYSHNTFLTGSMQRECEDCGAKFEGDYFAARAGGGDVLQYYRMISRGTKETGGSADE